MRGDFTDRAGWIVRIIMLAGALVLLLYLPLFLALLDFEWFGAEIIEDAARRMGVHGLLDKLYSPIVRLLDSLNIYPGGPPCCCS